MKRRILLVDDHQIMSGALRSLLESEGNHEVVGEAADGRSALEMVRSLRPQVVIMDVAMQDLNGIEATRQIKAEFPDVKVIALSAYADKRYVLGMLEAGASGYVLKRAAYDELRRAVESVLSGMHYLSPQVTRAVTELRGSSAQAPSAAGGALLAAREREILQLVAEGHSSGEIAQRLGISLSTVETHRRNIMKKLDVHSVAELTKYAIREGLTCLDA